MSLAFLRCWLGDRWRWQTTAVAVWGAVILLVGVRVFAAPQSRTVYPIYSASGRLWSTGADLYNAQDGYRYSPTFAFLVTPFALLPDAVGGVLWRFGSAAALFGALAWFARVVLPMALTARHFAWLLLLMLPFCLQSVNNGQANLLVIACMLGAVAAVADERWNLASVLLALAFLCKLYPLALGMMLIVLYPRQLGWRMPAACLASLLLPFLGQHPAYVADQYEHWFALLRAEDRSNIHIGHMYRDLWLLIHLYDVPIGRSFYFMVQVAAGVLVALLCWHRRQAGWPSKALLTSALALATAWMMLLGPATESSSFALLAPSFAWSIVEALQTNERNARHGLLWGSGVLFAVAVLLGSIKGLTLHECGVHAWASCCYFAYLLSEPYASEFKETSRDCEGAGFGVVTAP